jgi:DNA-binding MarR family transcriptional regulator
MSRPKIQRGFQPEWLFENGFSAAQMLVLVYVQMRGQCWERKDVIAQKLRMGKGKLKRTLDELVALQWLVKSTKITNKKRANCYELAPVEGIRADEKKRQTHFAKPHVRPQTNALIAIYSAIEDQPIANNCKKQIPSKILTESKEPRSGDQRGVPNGPQSREDAPQEPFKPEVVEDKAKPPKKRPATENPHERGTGEWTAWMVLNGYEQFALTVGFDHWQIKHEAKPEKREKWG